MFALKNLSGNLTVSVEFLYWNNILVGSNLEYTVCRSIYDERTSLHMFLTIIPYYISTGIWLIAQNPSSSSLRELIKHLTWESLRICRKRSLRYNARNLPVANGSILPHRLLCEPSIGTYLLLNPFEIINAINIEKSHILHIRSVIFAATRNGLKGIGPRISKGSGVRRITNSIAVKNNYKYSSVFHLHHDLSTIQICLSSLHYNNYNIYNLYGYKLIPGTNYA